MKRRFLRAAALTAAFAAAAILTSACGSDRASDINAGDMGGDEYTPVSSITLSDAEAASLNGSVKVKLYYRTQEGSRISSEVKLLQFTDEYKKTDVLASKMIEMLIAGPSNPALVRTLPEGTALNSVHIKGGVIYVDLNEAFAKAVSEDPRANLTAYSIADTLTEFKNITEVAVTSGGNKIESVSGCDFSKLCRNTEIVTDIESAALPEDYSENVFLEIELE